MQVSQHLVFIHLTKCAGTFTKAALQVVDGPLCHQGRYHASWSELPEEFRSMPVLTIVRNPFDWWVSWYHEMKRKQWFNPMARAAVLAGCAEFEDMVGFFHAAVSSDADEAHLVDALYNEIEASWQVLPYDLDRRMFDYLKDKRCGILSWRFAMQLEGVLPEHLLVGRQESLIDDLHRALAEAGLDLPEAVLVRLHAQARINTTQRETDYRTYYTRASTREFVADLDRTLIERFDYQF